MPSAVRLILASESPRRRQLLEEAGYVFDVEPAGVDEQAIPPRLLPSEAALHLARQKADIVSARHPDAVVLGADTVVAFGDQLIGKPRDAADALRMLRLLSGTTHIVITGIAVRRGSTGHAAETRVMSAVRVRVLTAREIDDYIASGEWQGKAGGYGIQDPDPFVTRMTGSHSNIVGLPMEATRRLLEAAGVKGSTDSQ